VDFWGFRDIHLTQESLPDISLKLFQHNISFETIIQNVQEVIDRSRIKSSVGVAVNDPNPDPFFDDYQPFATINEWVKNQSINNPNLMTVTELNTTFEGRPIIVAKITNGTKAKPIIYYEGGIHAREWIGHATVCYIISKLLNQSDPDASFLLNTFEFHIVPIVNGDGYEYTWTTDRTWRKTRKPNPGSDCVGTDPNRNWDDHWCEEGASNDPCSNAYCGSSPWSEREVLTIANYITTTLQKQEILVFIDWHSCGQLWMAPWGWTCDSPPENDAKAQQKLGLAATQAIYNTNGFTYQYGTICNIIYPASGSSADWGYDVAKILYSYGVELRPTGGQDCFLLPADQIRPQGEEIWYATVAIGRSLHA